MRIALLALLAILPYLPAMGGDFVWDDRLHIVGNPHVETLSAALAAVGRPEGLYHRPLVFLSYAVEKALFGESAFAFHLFNVLLHGLNASLLFIVARRSGLAENAALLGASIFALHPLQGEAVIYISGRTDLLMTAAALLAWLAVDPPGAHLPVGRAVQARRGRRAAEDEGKAGRSAWLRGLLAGLATLVAIASKETGYALAILVPWIVYRRSGNWMERLALAAPTVLVAAVMLLCRPVSLPGDGGSLLAVLTRVGLTAESYLRLLVLPTSLQVDRLIPMTGDELGALIAALVAVSLVGLALLGLRGRGPIAEWTAWTAAFYLPAANAWALYPDIAGRALFAPEHNLYAPLAGIGVLSSIAATWLVARVPRLPERAGAAIAAALLLVWASETWARCRDWHDERTLFQSAARAGSRSPRVWFNLGNSFLASEKFTEAVVAYDEATRLAPSDPQIWANLGVAQQQQGALAEAAAAYERSLALAPSAQVYRNLAGLEMSRGDADAAERALAAARLYARTRSEVPLPQGEAR